MLIRFFPKTRSMRLLLVCMLSLMLASCVSHEQLVNFNTGPEFPTAGQPIPPPQDPVIQPQDGLAISIQALDPEVVQPFTLGNTGTSGGVAATGSGFLPGGANYQVNLLGQIDIPLIGTLQVGGLTVAQARDSIMQRLQPFIKDPFVNIRRLPVFRFSVLGDVRSPATFTLNEDRVTLLQAIGMAGDVNKSGNRESILIVREKNGQREYARLSLRDRGIFQSPYFYLQPNDLIYVEPLRAVAVSEQSSRVLTWVSAGWTVVNLILILSRL